MKFGYLWENNLEKSKILKVEEKILSDIQKSVFDYLEWNNEELPYYIKNNIGNIKDELLEWIDELKLNDISIEQFAVRYLWEEHRQVSFVLTIWNSTKSVSSIINNNWEEVVNLTLSNKNSRVLEKRLDKRDNTNVLVRSKNRQNFQEHPEKEWIKIEDNNVEDFPKEVFQTIVVDTWNEIFLKNKEELDNSKNDKEEEYIIEKNATAIADLFTWILQGTVDYTHSTYEYIKDYFIHFLEKSPNLLEAPTVTDIRQIEDWVIVANWTYKFELDWVDESWKKTRNVLPANFTFIFTKGSNWNWTIAGLHSYTD